MKYCYRCGNELVNEAVVCPKCGCAVKKEVKDNRALKNVAFAFMIFYTICFTFLLIPLCWMVPMTLYYRKATNNHEEIGKAFKICTLLFVSIISGILMLCDSE